MASCWRRARDLGVAIRFVTESGDVTHTLTKVAHAAGAELVVVDKPAGMLRHLTGSAAARLISCHDAPVVVVVPEVACQADRSRSDALGRLSAGAPAVKSRRS
jgi:septum formation inhibitor-activating ATPase MinD